MLLSDSKQLTKWMFRLLVAGLLATILAGCGQRGTEVTFVFLTSKEDEAEQYWNGVISDFEAVNPDVNVDLQVYGWGEGRDKIQEMVDQGQPPSLAKVATRWLPEYVSAGLVEPVDSYMTDDFRSEFYPVLMDEGAQYQGRTFGLPIAFTTRALYYNKDIFADAGISNPPETWQDLFDAAIKIGALPGDVAASKGCCDDLPTRLDGTRSTGTTVINIGFRRVG